MACFVLANLFGMTIIMGAIQFGKDVMPIFKSGDSFMKEGQMVITKRINSLSAFSKKSTDFSEKEINDIREQPFVKSVGLFTPSQFFVYATLGNRESGMSFSTEMFFESVPDEFLDINLDKWHYTGGGDTIPIILPRNYLNLYNFGFAASNGLPVLSESIISSVKISLSLTGSQGKRNAIGKVVAFSRKLNTILVPIQFMDEANGSLSPERSPKVSRVIIKVDNPADERIATFLAENNYDTESDDSDASKSASMLRLITIAVAGIGLIICALSFYVLLLSIFLLLQKHTDKIDSLLLIGYSTKSVGWFFHMIAIFLNFIVFVVAVLIAISMRDLYLPRFGELYPRLEVASILPTIICGLSIFIIVSVVNYIAIRKKILSIWNLHKEK